jgi:hypothetical protein
MGIVLEGLFYKVAGLATSSQVEDYIGMFMAKES